MGSKIIVTGASGSMGSAAVKALTAQGREVVMACRNLDKAESVRHQIVLETHGEITLRQLDLSSFDSVRNFVAGLKRDGIRVAALFNNAGTMCRDFCKTADGYEMTVATNYMGPYLLTRLMTPLMDEGAHVTDMVSLTCRLSSIDENFFTEGEKEFSQLGTYGKSKLAFLLFTVAFARRHPELNVNMADPGIVNSNMISMGRWFDPLADVLFRPLCKSPERGVRPALLALSSNDGLRYFVGHSSREVSRKFLDNPLIDWLWEETEKLVGIKI